MKRMIRSNDSVLRVLDTTGKAGKSSDKRNGIVKLGSSDEYDLGNGFSVYFPSAVTNINLKTGETNSYVNMNITRNDWEESKPNYISYSGLTIDQVSEIYSTVKDLSYEELDEVVLKLRGR